MYVRFQLSKDTPQLTGRMNARALRLFSEKSGRSITAAIGELIEWYRDDEKSYSDIPFDLLDLSNAAYALANSDRKVKDPPDFETVEEEFDEFGAISLVQGFANALTEGAELYSENPILGPILSQISTLIQEAETAVESAATGSSSGPSEADPSESPEASTSTPSSGTEPQKSLRP